MTEQYESAQQGDAENGAEFIGIVILGGLDGCTGLASIIARNAIQALLRRRGIEWDHWGGSYVSSHLVEIFRVKERGPALQAIISVLGELCLLNLSLVAYSDFAEGYWRVTHRGLAGDFEQFLNDEFMAKAHARDQAMSEAISKMLPRSASTKQNGGAAQ